MIENIFPALRKKRELQPRREESVWDFVDDMLRSPQAWTEAERMVPAVDVSEDEKEYRIKAELPGMDPKDLNVSMEQNYLIIKGEKKREEKKEEKNYIHREVSYGSFYRSIPLASKVQEHEIQASYKNGVLHIVLPKEKRAQAKRIQIT
ncbi:MAG: Hsp20/alpha crystallin family protein [Desulfovibrionales bacterium]